MYKINTLKKSIKPLIIFSVIATLLIAAMAPNLSQIVSADKNRSVGKALNEAFPSPKRGNQVGKDAVLGTQIGPGPGVSHYSLNINEECRSQR
jgi:Na+-translocating ferredoxin:NAD+ oxidoreductase RnfG subunit